MANGEQGVFSRCPLTIHQERQKASYNIKLLQMQYVFAFEVFVFLWHLRVVVVFARFFAILV
ncbi:hypothetical protein MUO98_06870 [Candidatus Bathyarchaeota archaeon]|nr:hypothetical protein [Candidatus Bathyarchaeota archaeon]